MKTYGKEPESLGSITQIFLSDLADYPTDRVMQAIKTHSQRSQEFPTVSDIVGLIRRNGRAPLKESDVISIRKKDGQDRTAGDWAILNQWDKQQQEEWESDYHDDLREESKDYEILQLRQKVQKLESENARAWAEVKTLRVHKGLDRPPLTVEEKVKRTIDSMRDNGANAEDIQEFAAQYGMVA